MLLKVDIYNPKAHTFGYVLFCYGDEENARIYAVHLTTANQSEIRRVHLVSLFANLQIFKYKKATPWDVKLLFYAYLIVFCGERW